MTFFCRLSEVCITLVTFWVIAENNLSVKHKFMSLLLNSSRYDSETCHFAEVVVLKKMYPLFDGPFFHNIGLWEQVFWGRSSFNYVVSGLSSSKVSACSMLIKEFCGGKAGWNDRAVFIETNFG